MTLENHTIVGGRAEAVGLLPNSRPRIAPPDDFLDAGALPTLHDRYGLSTDAIVVKVRAELGSDTEPSTESHGVRDTAPRDISRVSLFPLDITKGPQVLSRRRRVVA